MHPRLEVLLQIQDLRSQRDRFTSAETAERDLQHEQFNIDVDRAVGTLEEKIASMEDQLDRPTRSRYDRIAKGRDRVVAPVIEGTCYACFVSVPTAHGVSAEQNRAINHCENCGRFLYVVG